MTSQILCLNKHFTPISVINLKKAITLLFKEKAKILEVESYNTYTWNEWYLIEFKNLQYQKIKTPKKEIYIPEIIILKEYDKIQKKRIMPNKKNIYKRDRGECQYCGKFLPMKDSTIDHINPKSKNGKLTWENCVISCLKCNLKKGDKDLKDIGMNLIRKPAAPNYEKINFYFFDNTPKSWEIFKK
jgi:5-methylcytosine-specific restriction endonuclease McrA